MRARRELLRRQFVKQRLDVEWVPAGVPMQPCCLGAREPDADPVRPLADMLFGYRSQVDCAATHLVVDDALPAVGAPATGAAREHKGDALRFEPTSHRRERLAG